MFDPLFVFPVGIGLVLEAERPFRQQLLALVQRPVELVLFHPPGQEAGLRALEHAGEELIEEPPPGHSPQALFWGRILSSDLSFDSLISPNIH